MLVISIGASDIFISIWKSLINYSYMNIIYDNTICGHDSQWHNFSHKETQEKLVCNIDCVFILTQ